MFLRTNLLVGGSIAVLTASLALATGAAAQTAAPDSQEATTVDEIVVTANKRSENVQDVPVAVTVVTPQTLINAGASQLSDLGKVAPSLTITPEVNPVNASIIVRGVGTFAFSVAVEPAVSIVIDDVPQAFQAQAFSADLGAIQRIEVLRGPQSTLFGKSASAGLINITTLAPTDVLSGNIEAVATDDDEYRLSGSISGPITDTLRFRLNGATSDYAGPTTNLTDGSRINGIEQTAFRGRLNWTPTEALTIDVGANYSTVDSNCCQAAYVNIDPAALLRGLPGFTGAQVTRGMTVDRNNADTRLDSALYANSELFAQNLRVSYDFASGYNLLGVSSHAKYDLQDSVDNDFSDLDIIPAFTGGTVTGRYFQSGSVASESYTDELRLTSPGGERFEFVAGLYFQSSDNVRILRRGPAISVVSYDAYFTSKSYAVFGQGTYDLTDATRLIGGLRVGREDIDYRFVNNIAATTLQGDDTDTKVTGRLGIQHDLSPDAMLFATYNRGNKGQAYDLTSVFNAAIAAAQPIQAEVSDSYEVGLRSQFLDRRITANLTGFWTDYSNFQAQALRADVVATPILTNVGSVRTRGVELEGSVRLTQDFTLSGGVTYTDAGITEFPNAGCYPQQTVAQGCVGGVQNLAGGDLPNSPKWKLNLNADWFVPLPSLPFDGQINASYGYQSAVMYSLVQDPITHQDGYGVANLSAGIVSRDGDYKLTVFVNNLFDEHYYARIDNRSFLFNGGRASAGIVPRDFNRYAGVRLSAKF